MKGSISRGLRRNIMKANGATFTQHLKTAVSARKPVQSVTFKGEKKKAMEAKNV